MATSSTNLEVYVFYGAQFLGNQEVIDDVKSVPDGAYIRLNGRWYTMVGKAMVAMNKPIQLPPETMAQLTLLGLTV